MLQRSRCLGGALALFGLVVLTPVDTATAAANDSPRAGLSSPLRAGARPGCRWVAGAAKATRVCNTQTGVCRTVEVPAQRIWACGTVRD